MTPLSYSTTGSSFVTSKPQSIFVRTHTDFQEIWSLWLEFSDNTLK